MSPAAEVLDTIEPEALSWQIPLVERLVALKRQQRLPHALMIELETQVDSRSFGWYLVTALLCEDQQTSKPCLKCPACQLMQANNYPDFTFTTLEENDKTHKLNKDIKIDQIRRLIHQLALTDSRQAGKYALIYPAEKMNQSSANSLLKTLEEPSANSTLILLTHNPGRLPVTIRSRCQRWPLNNPDDAAARAWMLDSGMPKEHLDAYLELAHADAQLALELMQQDFAPQHLTFRRLLDDFLQNRIAAAAVVQGAGINEPAKLRLLVKTELVRLIYQQLQQQLTTTVKQQLAGLLELIQDNEHYLRIEDNNLNLQIQLEDLLISMKRVLTRE